WIGVRTYFVLQLSEGSAEGVSNEASPRPLQKSPIAFYIQEGKDQRCNAKSGADNFNPMIVRPRPHWLRMLFVWRGSVLQDIAPQLLWTTAFAVLVTVLHGRLFQWKVPLNFVPFSLIGLTLAIFLGFRNGTSYSRY